MATPMQLDDVRRALNTATPIVRSAMRSPIVRSTIRRSARSFRRNTYRGRLFGRRRNLGAARRVRRTRRQRRQAFSPRNIAFECNVNNYLKHYVQGALVTRATRTFDQFHAIELTNLAYGLNPGNREANVVNVNSFTVRYSVRNNLVQPLCFHIAMISTRNNSDPSIRDFFRGPSGNRGIDFDESTNNSHVFNEYGLNTDKFVVLTHKRHWLTERKEAGQIYFSNVGRNYVSSKIHKRINRQFRWDNIGSDSPIDGNVYIIYWADILLGGELGQGPTFNSPPIADAFQFHQNYIMRFKNQYNC